MPRFRCIGATFATFSLHRSGLCKEQKKIIITIDKTNIITRLMQGQFPKYNQLIPQTFPKEAVLNKADLISALERVAVMVNEKNSIVK